ncbi:MAG: helix-turn-helix transcriptional regulator [Phycisphaerales bacterium]|nr:MAG: helix-turn-helix transcriptional regulator [Phycisphaerales bacterium]
MGQKIRTYRQLLGIRRKDLARRLGVDRSTIGHLERSKHRPEKKVPGTRALPTPRYKPRSVLSRRDNGSTSLATSAWSM